MILHAWQLLLPAAARSSQRMRRAACVLGQSYAGLIGYQYAMLCAQASITDFFPRPARKGAAGLPSIPEAAPVETPAAAAVGNRRARGTVGAASSTRVSATKGAKGMAASSKGQRKPAVPATAEPESGNDAAAAAAEVPAEQGVMHKGWP